MDNMEWTAVPFLLIQDVHLLIGILTIWCDHRKRCLQKRVVTATEERTVCFQISAYFSKVLSSCGMGGYLLRQEQIFAVRSEIELSSVHSGAGEITYDRAFALGHP